MESVRLLLLDAACLLVAALPCLVLNLTRSPPERGFFCSDDTIRYPYRPDTISVDFMAFGIVPASVLGLSAGEACRVFGRRGCSPARLASYAAALYKVLGTYFFGLAVSQSFTDVAKFTTGRLRPNFLAVCDPDWSRVNCSGYVRVEALCRGDPSNVTNSRLSFYSGHSSFIMYCMVFLALYVQSRLRRRPWARLLRPTVQAVLLAFALYVGYTRVDDHMHHWSDVLTGLLLGALLAGLNVGCVSDFFRAGPAAACADEEVPGPVGPEDKQGPLSLSLPEPSQPIDKTGSRQPVINREKLDGSVCLVGEKVSRQYRSLEKERKEDSRTVI
ncbi:phospholipid phosphatase 2-like isoform X2 [Macrotis lagotis]|uniref:phospholipid phosphatase 2-like isoform X2 n=1 Tax=Macrotis lagotis TaxID=92651 RepID=UPI003D686DBD